LKGESIELNSSFHTPNSKEFEFIIEKCDNAKHNVVCATDLDQVIDTLSVLTFSKQNQLDLSLRGPGVRPITKVYKFENLIHLRSIHKTYSYTFIS